MAIKPEPPHSANQMAALIEAWQIHNRINLFLLDGIAADSLNAEPPVKFRTVGKQFAHIHNVRLMWLKAAAPDLMEGLEKLDGEEFDAKQLKNALNESSMGIEKLLARAETPTGKIKNFKPHAAGFFGYIVSHESHHRGQIALTLRQLGQPLDKKTSYGMWEWGSR